MTDPEKVRAALAELKAGDEIRVKLDTGEEVVGVLRGVDSAVHLVGVERPIALGRITSILIDISTEGPE